MQTEAIVFYILSGMVTIFALGILFTDNLLHAAFLLLVVLLGVSGIFVFAGADFLAVAQILIYIGGILVLILFGIMLTKNESVPKGSNIPWKALTISISLFGLMSFFLLRKDLASTAWLQSARQTGRIINKSTIETIGIQLLTENLFPFELAGILLLLALIGAVFIAGNTKYR